jgi:hypothetical protein
MKAKHPGSHTGALFTTMKTLTKSELSKTPQRIVRSRKRGWRLPPNTVCVSRPGKWGNPYGWNHLVPELGEKAAKARAVELFKAHLASNAELQAALHELRGKNLCCWCGPNSPCHANVLLEAANGGPAQ